MKTICSLFLLAAITLADCGAAQGTVRQIGLARVDITPNYPVRLSGYASRKTESEGVAQRIWAKAMAIGSDREKPAILITVDNCGVPGAVRNEVARRLKARHGLDGSRLAICSSHTHSAPWLCGYLPNLVLGEIPPGDMARRQRYTAEITDALAEVASKALMDRQLSLLSRGTGKATFAANRRTKGGPVDHELPALFVMDKQGKVRGMLATYACHCTTLTGEFNQICGDWAGYAQEALERTHPGCIAMISVGCGGDANPDPRPGFELAQQHGQSIAAGVEEVLTGELRPVKGKLACEAREVDLGFDRLPTRPEWEEKAKDPGYVGQHARLNLARLDRGEVIPTSLPYLVQVWSFSDNLAMVFLPGEVVVDYALRLKRESAESRVWVTAYANDVPCYIPSERVLTEGGYEGGYAMVYYDQPTRFAPGVEDRIVQTVTALLPKSIRGARKAPGP